MILPVQEHGVFLYFFVQCRGLRVGLARFQCRVVLSVYIPVPLRKQSVFVTFHMQLLHTYGTDTQYSYLGSDVLLSSLNLTAFK